MLRKLTSIIERSWFWSHEIAQSPLSGSGRFSPTKRGENNFEENRHMVELLETGTSERKIDRKGGRGRERCITRHHVHATTTMVHLWQKFVCELVFHRNNSCRECRVRDDDVSRYWKSRHIKNAMRRFVWAGEIRISRPREFYLYTMFDDSPRIKNIISLLYIWWSRSRVSLETRIFSSRQTRVLISPKFITYLYCNYFRFVLFCFLFT